MNDIEFYVEGDMIYYKLIFFFVIIHIINIFQHNNI